MKNRQHKKPWERTHQKTSLRLARAKAGQMLSARARNITDVLRTKPRYCPQWLWENVVNLVIKV